ncbi:dephospho-CoA kinase [Haliscomenobacter hydrossis]|uniref:Dephospho-CoA kinase n=1 Tax=Haliscomenobacter hydrossis (strain ATCC 27775 / DSM 1100 / LMG 10767 / O) TaxID=760192 RepID=F4KVW9_HALH1|nr:dephospho-CoA kinase [Haliscomenobacter hydrossis]AEE53544.1 Dephospho-CoA kinase [Haliscomenobacter hydrossis DSM 1100]
MQHLGITGGIGSGKTTVCKIFETLGIPVYYADERAKYLMSHDRELIAGISTLFGPEAYLEPQVLNRAHIAQHAFNDQEKLAQLNALVHPAVARDGLEWQTAQHNVPYTLKEAALLFESGSYRALDQIIVVTAPIELRIQRVMARDAAKREAVEARISKQMPEEEKVNLADFVIYNDGVRALIPQVLAIHRGLIGN